jgi:hypothetical protein
MSQDVPPSPKPVEESVKKGFISRFKGFISRFKDYFWDKICDKLLVIIITGIIIFVYQEYSKHQQKIQDDAVAAGRIYSEIISKQRIILSDAIIEYIQVLGDLEDIGKANRETLAKFRNLRIKVLVVAYTLYPLDDRIKKSFEPLIIATEKASTELTQKRGREYIKNISNDILQSYLNFMEELRKITINIVEKEIIIAEKELSKERKWEFFGLFYRKE